MICSTELYCIVKPIFVVNAVYTVHAFLPSSLGQTYRVLIFNSTGDRDPETLLQFLPPCNFDLAIFTTNLVTTSMSASSG